MKKILSCALFLVIAINLSMFAFAADRVSLRGPSNDEYSSFFRAFIYDFDTAGNTFAIGTLKEAGEEMESAAAKYIPEDAKVKYFRIDGYDSNTNSFIHISDVPSLKIYISRPASGGGNDGIIGAGYRMYHYQDGELSPLTITSSNNYGITFLTDKLGYFVLVYNDNVLDFTFMLDEDTVYKEMNDLSVKDAVNLPEEPTKEGFIFDGWYFYASNPAYACDLEDGMELAEIAADKAYARWKRAPGNTGFDVNGDDRSDYYDIRAVMDHVIGGEDPRYNILNADFNGDNRITMYDLNQLLISFVKSSAE
ncbi:MAG: hypothetical protein E7583_08925 [Ruminococcaceae bacterium]|nr:hypothetical protein [Oscillospiraceae bacterium]